jgi:hypothetical protein
MEYFWRGWVEELREPHKILFLEDADVIALVLLTNCNSISQGDPIHGKCTNFVLSQKSNSSDGGLRYRSRKVITCGCHVALIMEVCRLYARRGEMNKAAPPHAACYCPARAHRSQATYTSTIQNKHIRLRLVTTYIL